MAGGVELATAYVSLVVEGSKVAPGVRSALGSADGEAARSGERAGRSFTSRFGSTLKVGAALGAAFAATKGIQFLGDAIEEAREASVVTARTSNVIKSMGNVAGVSAKQVANLAGAISNKVGIDDEAIQSGENLLLTFGKIQDAAGAGNDIFTQTTGLMVDMSVAMDQDMKSSAIQLGKALNDPVKGVTALSRVGVSFTEQQIEQIKALTETNDVLGAQKIILGEVEKQFGGAGKAMATPADRAKVAWGNLKEQIGTELLPVVNRVSEWFADEGIPAASKFVREFEKSKGTGGEVRDIVEDIAGHVQTAAGYAKDFVGWLDGMPGWAKNVMAGGAAAAFVAPKIPGLSLFSKGAGSFIGKTMGVQKVFETNPAALGGGPGGPGGATKGVPFLGTMSGGALATFLGPAVSAAIGAAILESVTPDRDKPDMHNFVTSQMAGQASGASMPLPAGAINFGADDTSLLKQAEGMKRLTDAVYAGLTAFTDLKGAVHGADDGLAAMMARNPDKAIGRLQTMADLAGVSFEDLTGLLPKTAAEMDKAGYSAEGAKIRTGSWRDTIIDLGKKTDDVDGKKPKVPFEFPGLTGGIGDILTAGIKTDEVGKKRPHVPFEFPNLTAGLFNVQSLDRSITNLPDHKTITITTFHSDVFGAVSSAGGHEAPEPKAMGGPVYAGRPYIVGERRPELFVPSANGYIDPNPKVNGAGLSDRDVERLAGAIYLAARDGFAERTTRQFAARRS